MPLAPTGSTAAGGLRVVRWAARWAARWSDHWAARQAALLIGGLLGAASVTAQGGDAARGAAIAGNRTHSLCVLCHALPGVPGVQSGTLGPALAGVASRLTADELRQRLVAPEGFNPDTVMPSYRRTEGLQRVAAARQGQPLFDAQQLEDVLAYLATLR